MLESLSNMENHYHFPIALAAKRRPNTTMPLPETVISP